MRRQTVLLIFLTVSILTITLVPNSCADSPLPPPELHTIWSANKRFFAILDPKMQITTIYKLNKEGRGEKVWAMYGWFRVASLADDGEHFVTVYEGGNLIPLDYDKHQPMIYFIKRGELRQIVRLDQIIRDFSKLGRGASHYHWCDEFLGFDPSGLYVIKTAEGRTLRFDVSKGIAIP